MGSVDTSRSELAQQFQELIKLGDKEEVVPDAALREAYNALPSIEDTEFLTRNGGEWDGMAFNRDADDMYEQMQKMNWAGKTFISDDVVEPMLLYSDPTNPKKRVIMEPGSKAILRVIKHRGVYTTGMIYDDQQMIDYFRKVDENTMVGVMDAKAYKHVPDFYFVLKRTQPI